MAKQKRRHFTPQQKAQAVLRHVQDGVRVSQLCDELKIHPNVFYKWHKQAMSNLASAFERDDQASANRQQRKLQSLENELQRKDSVIAELLSEHIMLKKSLGDD